MQRSTNVMPFLGIGGPFGQNTLFCPEPYSTDFHLLPNNPSFLQRRFFSQTHRKSPNNTLYHQMKDLSDNIMQIMRVVIELLLFQSFLVG
ncbi:hypothetical protein FKM82_017666 [Ascaphus truei]